jgi:hypothetical protein
MCVMIFAVTSQIGTRLHPGRLGRLNVLDPLPNRPFEAFLRR